MLKPIPDFSLKYGKPRYRHTNADKGPRVEPEEILEWIEKKHWHYGLTDQAFYIARDRALVSLTYVLCGRIGEILALTKNQFEDTEKYLIIHNYHVEKNKQNPLRDNWALSKVGRLAPFTMYTLGYLAMLKSSKLFLFKRSRAFQIIKHISGFWPHWFRCMGEAYYMRNVFKEPVKCATALRLRRSDTLIEYVPFNWEDYAKELSA
jgi:hypothetical protein